MKLVKEHWLLIALLAAAAWYVVHKNCPPCQKRMAAMMGKAA